MAISVARSPWDRYRRLEPRWPSGTVAVPNPKPTIAPAPGTYDPSLDAALRAAERGFGDLTLDTEKAGERADSQRILDTQAVGRTSGRSLADLLRERGRATQDFSTQRDDTRRGYRELGGRQAESAASAGVAQGGTLRAALAARTADQGRDIGRIDQSEGRFLEDSRLAEGRLTEDRDIALAEIERLFGYGSVDRQEGLARALRELGFFGTDTAEQRAFQASQAGLLPELGTSKKPKGKGGGKKKSPGKKRNRRRGRLRTQITGGGAGLGG
jgi:hypothetical protein